jgi:peroxiredoxin
MAAIPAQISSPAMLARSMLLRYKLNWFLLRAKNMQLNDKAPDFALPNEEGTTVSLKDYRGKTLILFFYPKANTSG